MKWTVSERPAEIGRGLTVFEINEKGRGLYLISAQSSEHCTPGYGWTADELRERVRLMAAAPRLEDAARMLVLASNGPDADFHETVEEAIELARAALALLDASEVKA